MGLTTRYTFQCNIVSIIKIGFFFASIDFRSFLIFSVIRNSFIFQTFVDRYHVIHSPYSSAVFYLEF